MSEEPTITIDGTEYKVSDLSDNAKNQLTSIRAAEQEMARLQALLGMLATARNSYVKEVQKELAVNESDV
jgi:hypothetical protein